MRKSNQEITDRIIIEDILSNSQICRLALNDKEAPYLLPFNYGYKDNCIYIHSACEGKKIDLLRNNPKVCFEIESCHEIEKKIEPCKWSAKYRSVIGYGSIEIQTEYNLKISGLEIIMAHYGAAGPFFFDRKAVDRIVILKLPIDSVTGKQSENWNNMTCY